MNRTRAFLACFGAAVLLAGWALPAGAEDYWPVKASTVVDLSATVSMSHSQFWPGGSVHHQPIIVPYIKHGPSAYAADLLLVDNDTATQLDCPPHMMPDQSTGLPNSGYWGFLTCDLLPAWKLIGEVVKIDGRSILDQAPNGQSPIFTVAMVKKTEQAIGRSLGPSDAVLYWSGYDDKYDKAGKAGERLIFDPVRGTAPSWPAPNWDTQDYVGSEGVRLVGLDSPSIGAFGSNDYNWKATQSYRSQTFKALESHLGMFKYGGIDAEALGNLDKVPNGSVFITHPIKVEALPTASNRAVAITDLKLAAKLMKAVRAHKVVDLTVLISENTPVDWSGSGVGDYAFPFYGIEKTVYYTGPFAPYWVSTQIMDSRTGTHISPPAFYGPPPGFSVNDYQGEVRDWAREFESKYGKIKNTDMTSDKVPVYLMMGPARVVNVQHRVGTTDPKSWPASPAITVDDVKAHERTYGPIRAGEVVIFHTGHTDAHFRKLDRSGVEDAMRGPLSGATEGWPAPTPEVIKYLAGKGVKHLAIDTPSMGSVNPKESAFTHWAAANEGMIFTQYLIGVGSLPPKGAFYIFLNPKIENNHGGPGRATAILPNG